MRARVSCLPVLLVTGFWVSSSFAEVLVSFADPQRFTDIGRDARQASDVQREIAQTLQRLGKRHLSTGQKLNVEILDIDLAGNDRMLRGGQDVRILRGGADWPSIRLRYVLESGSGSGITDSGQESIADMAYMLHGARRHTGEYLSHEKRLLETWFKARIVDRKPAPR